MKIFPGLPGDVWIFLFVFGISTDPKNPFDITLIWIHGEFSQTTDWFFPAAGPASYILLGQNCLQSYRCRHHHPKLYIIVYADIVHTAARWHTLLFTASVKIIIKKSSFELTVKNYQNMKKSIYIWIFPPKMNLKWLKMLHLIFFQFDIFHQFLSY